LQPDRLLIEPPIGPRMFQWIDEQRGTLFHWVPVLFAIGIGTYFGLPSEPLRAQWWGIVLAMAAGLGVGWRVGPQGRVWTTAVLLCLAGFSVAGLRAHQVGEARLGFRYYGPIEGRIVAIDRSASDAVRLTLDRVVLRDMDITRTPTRIRVALHGQQGFIDPEPGLTIILTGHLSPPGGPVEPGGYDFQRQAWFAGLGAVGYTRTPVLAIATHERAGLSLGIYGLRMRMSQAVRDALPGRAGAFAAAITTGDRSGMDQGVLEALRAANLAHLLAISGLHMGLLTGFVFGAFRFLFALIPAIVLYRSSRKFAAVGALAAGAIYLALSGGNVATERAFIMVAVMFTAILVDRRAITLRAVAVAALIVLMLRPEALYGPGFQMSFAATTALVAVYGALRSHNWQSSRWPRWARIIGGVTLSSFVAGMATAPIAAAHFNQIPHFGLLANVVSVPLMGAIIMPAAVLAAILAPFGLAWIGLKAMEWPILWILGVAETVADLPGALSFVVAPGPAVLPLLALGMLSFVIVAGRMRFAGLPLCAAAFVLWSIAERPAVLISETGSLVGLMTPTGRALSKPRGDGFAALSWLENDGDPALQAVAYDRGGFQEDGRLRQFSLGQARLLHATGKQASAVAIADCADFDMVIVNVPASAPKTCTVYDLKRLRSTGALALSISEERLRVVTARKATGARLWSQ
jgi:competence protein ComEC